MATPGILDWLLASDPAIRWQALASLTAASSEEVRSARDEVATRGWGAQLLARQDTDGRWAGALYSPKWTSTTYTLLLLYRLGLSPRHEQAQAGCRVLWDAASSWDGGLNLAVTVRAPETCITGMLVALGAPSGIDADRLDGSVRWLLGQQLPDGGWNCDSIRTGSQHGSFHTSITVLEALHAYRGASGAVPVDDAMRAGRRFFLVHQLYRSRTTGEVVDPRYARFPFPPQWHFDVLRGLEHFAATDAPADPRLTDAIGLLRGRRRSDGRWPYDRPHPGRQWFRLEQAGPSRWATLRAMGVLRWWSAKAGPSNETDGPNGPTPVRSGE